MIVADTHAWIWWMGGSQKLSARARRELDSADEVGICAKGVSTCLDQPQDVEFRDG